MLKTILLIAVLAGSSMSVWSGVIVYHNKGYKNQVIHLDNVSIKRFNQKYLTFIRLDQQYKISVDWLISFESSKSSHKRKQKSQASAPGPVKKRLQKQEAQPPKKFPTELAAYILLSRYISGAGQSKDWYHGKEVTVSGVVELSEIRHGKVPMKCGITCFASKLPDSLTRSRTKGKYRVLKFKGTVCKGMNFKAAYIKNAKFVSSRSIKPRRKCRNSKKVKTPPITRDAKLASCSDLPHWGWLEQHMVGRTGRVICEMGADPEAYAMELYWARKLFRRKYYSWTVEVAGQSHTNRKPHNKLFNCQIVSWNSILKRPRRR